MDRLTHYLGGAASGLALASTLALPLPQAALSTGLAAVTAGGRFSPDMDQYKWWRTADLLLPDELLGGGGPLQHRGITHWWGLPALAAYAAWHHAVLSWWVGALLIGWISHLVGDFVFGKKLWGQCAGGIPLLPWTEHIGLGLDSGGWLDRFVASPALAALLGWMTWLQLAPTRS